MHSSLMQLQEIMYSGNMAEKIALAEQYYPEMHNQLKHNDAFASQLKKLEQESAALARTMENLNMGVQCCSCAAQTGGCCSAYMANNIDVLQLLINMLLDCHPVQLEVSGDQCCFLGHSGCNFIIKPLFCLNYNCSHINQALGKKGMQKLTYACGCLLRLQAAIEELILEQIAQQNKCD